MASSQLYKDARRRFVQDAEARYRDSKDLDMLHDFLTQNSRPEDAQAAAGDLKNKAGEKWGSKKVGDVEIPALWIDSLMANIGNFVAVGNYAMTGAPESVGLAWFAIKLTLSAIQSNYELYSFFGSALTDISEIMIMIPHYDRLYDERSKAASKNEWKPSPVVDKLFQDIINAYAAVLNFSFSVKRHLGAGTLAKWRHGIKDFFGASKAKFEGKMATIATYNKKILEDSQAIFQDKTLHQIDAVKDIVGNIKGTVSKIESFQSELRKMHEEQAAQWALVLKNMEDIKATTKPKTPWDLAIQKFEKNQEALDPVKNTSDALGEAIDRRHPGTCQWIFENPMYLQWKASLTNGMLCLNGLQDSGKSTILATVVEKLDLEADQATIMLYLNCGSSRGAATAQTLKSEAVCNTLLFLLYDRARQNENDLKLLEDCNKVFTDPKKEEKKQRSALKKGTKADNLPDFADAFLTIAARLKTRIVIAMDEADGLTENDQEELAVKIQAIIAPSEASVKPSQPLKFLVGCRSVSKFFTKVESLGEKLQSVDVGEFNDDDMKKQLTDELRNIPGLTQAEQEEATEIIVTKAGPRFAYIGTIAVPFMREPFRRPLSRRLEALPEGMSGVYSDAIRKMGPNYLELLRVALTWTLLAPVPLRVYEIMDVYHGTYSRRGPEVELEARTLEDVKFNKPSTLDIEQLQDARGPFLRLEMESWSGHHFVHLQDPPQVRDFCIRQDGTASEKPSKEDHICTRCMTATAAVDALLVSPKEGHLKLALECMRTMNNPIFQRRCTSVDKVPLWSQPIASGDVSGSENGHNENDSRGVDRITDIEESSNKESKAILNGPMENPTEQVLTDRIAEQTPDVGDTSKDATKVDLNDPDLEDSDESQDDEDRGDIDFSNDGEKNDEDETSDASGQRMHRYEFEYWSYHIRKAEELWSPDERSGSPLWTELFNELDCWVSENTPWFSRWQLAVDELCVHDGKLKPLHVAAYLGLTSWASYLLNKGADINDAPYQVSKTPLQFAALRADSPAMLQFLLENGADPNVAHDGSLSAFSRWLTKDSVVENIQLFLKHGANPTIVDEKNKFTVLHCFSWQGHDVAALELLLNYTVNGIKADINARDCDGDTALHMLLCRREVPIPVLQAFVDHGADVNVDNNWSIRPLQMACMYGELEALKVLCNKTAITQIDDLDNDDDTALHQAAVNDFTDCIRFLLELGANPNLQNKLGRAALHDVAWQGTKECVEVLLAHGAQPNILDKHNRTPLFFACLDVSNEEKAKLILDALLEKNIPLNEINAPTKRRRTPLREAAAHGFEFIVNRLIKVAEASNDFASLAIDERDTRRGMTPLHRAAWLGKIGCVRLLLSANANVAICDNDGKTPLVRAYEQWARASHLSAFEDIISLLIDKDPNAAATDPEIVAVCALNGSTRLLQQLCGIGANLNGQDQYGWTPLDLAQKSQQEAASRFLKQQAAWAGMLPSRWAKDTRIEISEQGTSVKHTNGQRVCISTNMPLPAGLDKFYFEVTSKPLNDDGSDSQDNFPEMAIGFCTIGGSAILFPGWPPRAAAPSARSWGYHADDGCLYNSLNEDCSATAEELQYHAGDTVGCGVDLNSQTMWFTRNGQKLVGGFSNVKGRLFPLLGLVEEVEVETNLTGPFMWKGDDEQAADEVKVVDVVDVQRL